MVCCLCSSMMARKQLMPGMMLICLPLHSSTMLLEGSMWESSKGSVVDLGTLVEGRMQWRKSCLWRQQATKPESMQAQCLLS